MRVFLNTSLGKTLLYIALIIFVLGIIYRLMSWFFKTVGTGDKSIPVSKRVFYGLQGLLLTIFSVKILKLIKSLILDVVLQLRILTDKKDITAWLMHICIFVGFVPIMFFHALQVPENYSTLNPYMFLRNLFGLIFVVGVVLAIIRRAVIKKKELRTGGADVFAIILLVVIYVTGFWLEGIKINSNTSFQRMVKEYGGIEKADEIAALEAYWVKNYHLASPTVKEPIAPEILEQGKNLNESCVSCHTQPGAAFISAGIAGMYIPSAEEMEKGQTEKAMLYIHAIACLFLLAYAPFSKMYHVISTPLSLLVAEASDKKEENANTAIRQIIELDGCGHGGACHDDCPVKKKRVERIGKRGQFAAVFDYSASKTPEDLGSRDFKS